MKKWFVEDTVTSSIGRCAGLLLGTDTRPTLENMKQVESMPAKFVNAEVEDLWAKPFGEVTITATREEGFTTASDAMSEIQSKLGGEIVGQSPICAHGHMLLKEGTSPKTQKPYHGYVCVERVKAKQCSPIWMTLSADGKWQAQI